jgi:hypothetical protein
METETETKTATKTEMATETETETETNAPRRKTETHTNFIGVRKRRDDACMHIHHCLKSTVMLREHTRVKVLVLSALSYAKQTRDYLRTRSYSVTEASTTESPRSPAPVAPRAVQLDCSDLGRSLLILYKHPQGTCVGLLLSLPFWLLLSDPCISHDL